VSGKTGLQAAADRVLLLSGTPCPNHAGELFPHYNTFWRDLLTHEGKPLGQTDFEERYTRYTDGPWGRAIHGSREQDRLRTALAPVILRRRREDVLPELPPLQLQDVPLTAGGPIIESTIPAVREITEALRAVPVNALVARLGGVVTDDSLNTLRRLLGETKAGVAAEWVRERLGLGVDKILVFAWHTSVIAKLAELLADFGPVTITGATSSAARSAAVHQFQNDPRVRVFIGQTRAAGSAITLTRATEVAIVEPSWVPGENDQAIARAWRLGQTQPVLVSFLFVPGSLDQRIMLAFRRKAQELMTLYVKNEPSKAITTGKHDHAVVTERTAAVTQADH
jgi:SNF2 family DNA or RNA helicase